MHTLDDASKQGQRLFMQYRHKALKAKDVGGNVSGNVGVAHK